MQKFETTEKQKPAEAGFYLKRSKLTDKPGSVVDSHSSRPAIAHWLKQPTRVQYGPYLVNPYLALLRVEFTVPRTVTSRAVRSYRTLSPLPDPTCAGHRRFALCCTGRRLLHPPGVTWHPALWSPDFPPLRLSPPKEDNDEAATVWSASARSIEGLRADVTPQQTCQPVRWPQCCGMHDKYCQKHHGTPLPAYQCWSER